MFLILINNYYLELEKIFNVLYEPGKFGASLETMYEQSSQISKNSYDYKIYEELHKSEDIKEISFPHYYEENGLLIKELETGEKWEIMLDSDYNEVLVKKIR